MYIKKELFFCLLRRNYPLSTESRKCFRMINFHKTCKISIYKKSHLSLCCFYVKISLSCWPHVPLLATIKVIFLCVVMLHLEWWFSHYIFKKVNFCDRISTLKLLLWANFNLVKHSMSKKLTWKSGLLNSVKLIG
jgi:hypothetical protein